MSRRLLAAVAAAALTFGLAACGDGGDGTVTEPPPEVGIGSDDGGASDGGGDEAPSSDGGGAEGDPVEAAPDIPAPDPADFPGMDENTPEGAEQAVRFYFANVYWGYQTGDSAPLRNLHTEECAACVDFVERIEGQSNGLSWSEVEITDFGITHLSSDSFDYEVGYVFTVGAHSEPTVDGEELRKVGNVDYTAAVGVEWDGDAWIVSGMTFGESGNG
ncbi:DUF6318 family protein [Brachybacterium sp. FME24]|uniref:DUF6318 family protein n=1 Tax=Brachybacterium sp. FME24 TaxID=2742605 RepID=UPI001865B704|nr:DUF6318 family protein [Brachybacterium sp. FME24]